MGGHPGLEIVIVVPIVPEDRLEAREGCGRDQRELRGSAAIIQPCAGDQNRDEEPSVSADMALTALPLLPPSYPRSGPPISVVLTD